MYDSIIIGGGIVGASVAYHLSRADARTLLIDRADPGRATAAGAGIISPETSRDPDPTAPSFAIRAAAYYPRLVASMQEDGVTNTGYATTGILVLDHPDRDKTEYQRGRDRIVSQRDQTQHPEPERLYEVSGEQAQDLFPPLAAVRQAIYYEDAARVDGRRFRDALVTAGRVNGLEIKHGTAERIETTGDAVSGVTVDGKLFRSETVVVAGGAWSATFASQLGVSIPVEPQRGQIVHLDLAETPTATWPIVNTFYGYYLVPWDDGRVAAGATRESGSGFRPTTTAEGIMAVLEKTLQLAPGLADAAILDTRVGLRPVSQDGRPIIGRVPGIAGGFVATGHGPSGLTLGPYSGKCVAALVLDRPIDERLDVFSPARF